MSYCATHDKWYDDDYCIFCGYPEFTINPKLDELIVEVMKLNASTPKIKTGISKIP